MPGRPRGPLPLRGLGTATPSVAIRRWCAAHGYVLTGGGWEVYGHRHDDPSELRTDVYYPVQAVDGPSG